MEKVGRDIQHYLPLVGVLVAGFLGFLIFSYDKAFQVVISISTATAYVAWGIVHHHIHKDLHLSVFVEYIVIALLGLIVAYSLIFTA